MDEADRRANAYERSIVSMVEAGLVADQVRPLFDGVIEVDKREDIRGIVVLSTMEGAGRCVEPRPFRNRGLDAVAGLC